MPRYRVKLELFSVRRAVIEVEAKNEDAAEELAETTSVNDEDIEKDVEEYQDVVEVREIGKEGP